MSEENKLDIKDDLIDREELRMPFTGHKAEHLKAILKSILKSGMPIEIFDAFLSEYAETKDLDKARYFATCEWDC